MRSEARGSVRGASTRDTTTWSRHPPESWRALVDHWRRSRSMRMSVRSTYWRGCAAHSRPRSPSGGGSRRAGRPKKPPKPISEPLHLNSPPPKPSTNSLCKCSSRARRNWITRFRGNSLDQIDSTTTDAQHVIYIRNISPHDGLARSALLAWFMTAKAPADCSTRITN